MNVSESTAPQRGFRYYDLLVGGMVAVLLCSNLIGPAKVVTWTLPVIGAITFGAGNLFFPIGYIFDDVLTEVYGYARSRRAIWVGFGAMIFATFMSWAIIALPPSPLEPFNKQLQPALEIAFGNTGRIALASVLSYWIGDFANSFVLAKMKLWTNGRHLWSRVVSSTIVGQGLDSITFFPVAFYGTWTSQTMVKVVLFNWAMKAVVEIVFIPFTYFVVGFLKRAEGMETFDRGTRYNPFSLADDGEIREYRR